MTKQQYVSIKGTKEGLVLRLDDKCAYSEIIAELRKKVEEDGLEGLAEVHVHTRLSAIAMKTELREIMNYDSTFPNIYV